MRFVRMLSVPIGLVIGVAVLLAVAAATLNRVVAFIAAVAVSACPAPIWSPSYLDNTQLTDGGLRDQQRVVQAHPRFLAAQVLLQMAGPRCAPPKRPCW